MSSAAKTPVASIRPTVAEQIADRLKEAIVGGDLQPGAALPSERELASKYDVNRSSIREALRRLETLGLVEIRHGGATRVRDFLVSAGLSLLPHLFEVGRRLDPTMLREVHELRGLLLGWCAEQAAHKADAASIARLEALVERMHATDAKPRERQELDYVFFEELVNITGNRMLAAFCSVVRDIYMRGREHFLGLYAREVFDPGHHRRAVEAIRRRDAAAALAAMRAYAASALSTVEVAP